MNGLKQNLKKRRRRRGGGGGGMENERWGIEWSTFTIIHHYSPYPSTLHYNKCRATSY